MNMSDIKEAINLITQLSDKAEDKKLALQLSQIQSLISSILMENTALESKNLELEKKISNLEKEHAKEISELKEERTAKGSADKYTYNETYGVYESKENGHYYCTSCLLKKGIESVLEKDPEGWHCHFCDQPYSNNSNED
jgi:hypothetical protein